MDFCNDSCRNRAIGRIHEPVLFFRPPVRCLERF